jgi:hypothetical protein
MIVDDAGLLCVYQRDVPARVAEARRALEGALEGREGVHSVQLMANFGWDDDATAFYGHPTLRGLVVCVRA